MGWRERGGGGRPAKADASPGQGVEPEAGAARDMNGCLDDAIPRRPHLHQAHGPNSAFHSRCQLSLVCNSIIPACLSTSIHIWGTMENIGPLPGMSSHVLLITPAVPGRALGSTKHVE